MSIGREKRCERELYMHCCMPWEKKRENLRVKHCDGTECEVIVVYRVSGTVCEASLSRESRIRVRSTWIPWSTEYTWTFNIYHWVPLSCLILPHLKDSIFHWSSISREFPYSRKILQILFQVFVYISRTRLDVLLCLLSSKR